MSTNAPLYPVGLVLQGKRCLVVGGGKVAARKVDGLLAAGADVTVVALEITAALASNDRVQIERRPYRSGEAAEGYRLVVTATSDRAVNQSVFDDADAAGVWVNSADDPERCSFTLPAVERRGPVTVAVATDGTAPALAAWLRDRIATDLPDGLEAIAAALAGHRADLHDQHLSTEGLDWTSTIESLVRA